MREVGQAQTNQYANVEWIDATADATEQPNKHFTLATFGSSFHTVDRESALKETSRILNLAVGLRAYGITEI